MRELSKEFVKIHVAKGKDIEFWAGKWMYIQDICAKRR